MASTSARTRRNQLDVYFGTGMSLYRQTFTETAGGPVAASGSWTLLAADNVYNEPADVAFDLTGRVPLLMAPTRASIGRTTPEPISLSPAEAMLGPAMARLIATPLLNGTHLG